MSTIAKGMITLTSVNDAYSVLLSPPSCSINTASDGSTPDLNTAYTRIQAYRGDVKVAFTMTLYRKSHVDIAYTTTSNADGSILVQLTAIPSSQSSGSIEFTVTIGQEYQAIIIFQYTVVRNSSMLDWVQDWNGRKTSIGGEYIITPKMFVGRKNNDNTLDGVYIGPQNATLGTGSAGIYGFKASQEIFHINESGGSIGGWSIESNGIISPTGSLKLLSSSLGGSIISQDSNSNVLWGIYENGEASFAAGNVLLHADGSASFTGSITASSGYIGGFKINSYGIYDEGKGHIVIDSTNKYIGIGLLETNTIYPYLLNVHRVYVKNYGGVYMHYTNANDYGFEAWAPADLMENESGNMVPDPTKQHKTLSLGSTNQIAGWSFDDTSLWIGTKTNILNSYASAGSITIGTNGLRGNNWYIDSDGGVSFLSGIVSFESNGGTISGWHIKQGYLYSNNVAIFSGVGDQGLYIVDDTIGNNDNINSITQTIESYGGIYLRYGDVPQLAGFIGQNCVFDLRSDGNCKISSWFFNDLALYRGTTKFSGFTNNSGDITIGYSGIRGKAWRFESDGSGGLAADKIRWTSQGDVTVDESVSVGKLVTIPETGRARIEAEGSEINIYGSDGIRNIKFGVDENGYAVLIYYDKNGNKLYDLGPNGLKFISGVQESFVGYPPYYSVKICNASTIADFFAFARQSVNKDNVISAISSTSHSDTSVLYRYTAARLSSGNQSVYQTGQYGNSASDAEAANGKLFEQNNVVVTTNPKANGIYRFRNSYVIEGTNTSIEGVYTITSLIKTDGDPPQEYTDYEEYYQNQSYHGDEESLEIDWSPDPSAADVHQLLHPVKYRILVLIVNGVYITEFPFFWQESQ